MKTRRLLLLALPLIGFCGCTKDSNQTSPLDGVYSGQFIETNPASAIIALPQSGNVAFSMVSGAQATLGNTGTITTGKGTFKVDGQTVNFFDTQAYPDNTGYNTAAVLSGSYTYKVKGDSLFLTKLNTGSTLYNYKLKKQ